MSLWATDRREHQNPDPFEAERVGHPEKLDRSLSIEVIEWPHLNVILCQE